jgi:Ca2+-transporting ATPase
MKSGTSPSSSPVGKGVAHELYTHDEGNNDMKAIDGLLAEIAMMLGRWSLYMKFIALRCKV